MKEYELTQKILSEEFENFAHTRNDPYSNAGSCRKLEEYIIAAVRAKISKGECLDWIYKLLNEHGVLPENIELTKQKVELQYSIANRFQDQKK